MPSAKDTPKLDYIPNQFRDLSAKFVKNILKAKF